MKSDTADRINYTEPGTLDELQATYLSVRRLSEDLCAPLAVEDYGLQAMPDVSPPKWHLAHTTWFFEAFVLAPNQPGYECFHPQFHHLFNSYYETVGRPFPRPQRGLLSRPTVDEVLRYRRYVDERLSELIAGATASQWRELQALIVLGIHHEQQHQELLLTDIKYNFWINPLRPAYREAAALAAVDNGRQRPEGGEPAAGAWLEYPGGLYEIGHDGRGFAFDNEGPRHTVYCADFALSACPVSNAEYLEFIEAGGYREPRYWLADGWRWVKERGWEAPLYWERGDGRWWLMTLTGMRPVDEAEPVCHVSLYEADAFARFRGQRLPAEAEWEIAARGRPIEGNLLDSAHLHPQVPAMPGASQLFGDVWEWTRSAYGPYPGYRPPPGAIGEYNGKFMSGQTVLRGGSCVTPRSHIRASYRNFFYPADRWQFTGIRLAEEA